MKERKSAMSNEIQFLLYNMPDADGKVQVVVKEETLWCTQKAMAQLFGVGVPAISKHLKNIFEEGELSREVVVSTLEITTQHGAIEDKMQTHSVDFYQFLTFNDYKILPDKGKISAAQAKKKAEEEYYIFNKTQRIDSDFDKEVREMLEKK